MIVRRQTLRRTERLRDSREFAAAREKGRRYVGRLLILNTLARGDRARRFGVITARSLGSAVQRNHTRRWLREIYRCHKHELKANFSLVVVARQAISKAKFSDVQTELLDLLDKAGARALP